MLPKVRFTNSTSVLIFCIALTIGVTACREQSSKTVAEPAISKSKPVFSIIDTLNKYGSQDSLFVYDGWPMYIGKANGKDFAIRAIADTVSLVYQKNSKGWWIVTDSLHWFTMMVDVRDLNGDGLKDIVVTANVTGAGGNFENMCLLYYKADSQFRHNDSYDLANIKYDSVKNLVYSAWWTGATSPKVKYAYSIDKKGDSLVPKEEAIIEPDLASNGEIATLSVYKYQGNKKILRIRIRAKGEKSWSVFERSVWDSKDEW